MKVYCNVSKKLNAIWSAVYYCIWSFQLFDPRKPLAQTKQHGLKQNLVFLSFPTSCPSFSMIFLKDMNIQAQINIHIFKKMPGN